MKKYVFIGLVSLVTTGCTSQRLVVTPAPIVTAPVIDLVHEGGDCATAWTPKIEVSVIRYDMSIDAPPVPNAVPASFFPSEMSRAGIEGEGLATVTIEEDGRVSSVVVDRTSQSEFESPTVSVLRRHVFSPAKRDRAAVRCIVQLKVQFILTEA